MLKDAAKGKETELRLGLIPKMFGSFPGLANVLHTNNPMGYSRRAKSI